MDKKNISFSYKSAPPLAATRSTNERKRHKEKRSKDNKAKKEKRGKSTARRGAGQIKRKRRCSVSWLSAIGGRSHDMMMV